MKFLASLEKGTNNFLKVIKWISIAFLASSVVFYVLNCILRYAFKTPLSWPEEYCTYIIVFMVFLMQSCLEYKDDSLSISVVWEKVKDKRIPRRILFTFKSIVTILMSIAISTMGFSLVKQQFQYNTVTPVMRIPFGVYYAAISVCFLLVVVVKIIHIFTERFEEEKGGE